MKQSVFDDRCKSWRGRRFLNNNLRMIFVSVRSAEENRLPVCGSVAEMYPDEYASAYCMQLASHIGVGGTLFKPTPYDPLSSSVELGGRMIIVSGELGFALNSLNCKSSCAEGLLSTFQVMLRVRGGALHNNKSPKPFRRTHSVRQLSILTLRVFGSKRATIGVRPSLVWFSL